jgi:hypothetical protein
MFHVLNLAIGGTGAAVSVALSGVLLASIEESTAQEHL